MPDGPGSEGPMSVVRRNVAYLLLSQGATWIVSILILVIVPGELGEAEFGQISFAFVYVSFFELVAIFGAGEYITKSIARNESTAGRYVWNTALLKLVVSILLAGVALGAGWILGFGDQRMALIAVYLLGMVINVVTSALLGGLTGLQRMGKPAFWNTVRAYVGALGGVAVLLVTGNVVLYALAFVLAGLIPLVGNSIALRHELAEVRHSIDFSVWKEVQRGGWPFFVLGALTVLYGTIDIPMIEAFTGSETVGWYTVAYRWVSMPAFFAVAIATAAFPALSAEGIELGDRFASMANRAMHVIVFFATPAAVGIALIADDFIRLLYGDEFGDSVPLMWLLALHIPVVGLDVILGTVAVAADRQRRWVIFSVAAALFNPLANLAMIPLTAEWFDNGAIGAAFTTVLTEFILMFGGLSIRPDGVFDRATRHTLGRVLLASALMVPAVLAVASRPLVVQVAIGGVVYLVASRLLGTIPLEELLRLRRRSAPEEPEGPPADVVG